MHKLIAALIAFAAAPCYIAPVSADTTTSGPPFELNECKVLYSGGWLLTQPIGMEVQFANDTTTVADILNINVYDSAGNETASIRDVGSFAPNVEVKHRYRTGAGQLQFTPLFAPNQSRVSCVISRVHFTDGTVWSLVAQPSGTYSSAATLPTAPTPASTASPQ